MRCLGTRNRLVAALLGCALFFQPMAALALTPNDPLFQRQWYLRQVKADRAWDMTTGSSSVVVAVLDSGVDATHPDIAENMWINTDEIPDNQIDDDHNGYVDDVRGWNFVANKADTSPMVVRNQVDEALAHGTIVSSIIAGKGNDGYGVAGVSWRTKIMPLVVLDGNGFGNVPDMVKAIRYAVINGAHIINMSLAGYEPDPDLAFALHQASKAGVLVVVAAGNDDRSDLGIDLETFPLFPACSLPGSSAILTVSATDALDQKAPYSNYGRTCVGISAPGFEFVAAHPLQDGDTASSTAFISGITGSSAAAPLVAGAAALVKGLRPTWRAKEIYQRLVSTADPIEEIQREEVRGGLGRGRLNVERAVMGLARPQAANVSRSAGLQKLFRFFFPL
ncbi:S8 family serine peptidase [Candidatus Uhrbacteria bacterium]|nr:S8 family serine peptidase [Candidatus Uhrbacteria bacterium]